MCPDCGLCAEEVEQQSEYRRAENQCQGQSHAAPGGLPRTGTVRDMLRGCFAVTVGHRSDAALVPLLRRSAPVRTRRFAVAVAAAALSVAAAGGFVTSASAAETAVVKGHVTSFTGRPIGGVVFKVRVKSPTSGDYFTVSGRTSRTGRYEAKVPRRGAYQLLVSDPGDDDRDLADGVWAPASTRIESSKRSVVINQRLHHGAGLSGRVYDSSGAPARAGLLVTAGVNSAARGFLPAGSTYTKAGGAYHFRNLSAGATVVRFQGPGLDNLDRFYSGFAGGAVFAVDAKPLHLQYGKKVTGTSLTFPVKASINGRVTVDGKVLGADPDNDQAVRFDLLDQSGTRLDGGAAIDDFHFRDLDAGTYYLAFAGSDPAVDHIKPEFYEDADSLAHATPIVLRPGQTVTGIHVDVTAK